MRVGVVSDSHGSVQALQAAVDAAGRLDVWLHAGDYYSDTKWLSANTGIPVYGVRGNCDFTKEGPLERVVELGGIEILLAHGHLYQVGYGLMRFSLRAQELGVSAAVYGHTHVPLLDRQGSLTILNPGSPTNPRKGSRRSIAVMEIRGGGVDVTMLPLE